jgi:hypothetical protein
VIFDTSQAHANTLFGDMFEWLELVKKTTEHYPQTLFVFRAHPDEMRAGKRSQESVMSWAVRNQLDRQPNIHLISPEQTISSYELIQRAKFCLVYNSSIGLEATILGTPVLCAGKARYTQYPTVFFPNSTETYRQTLESFLESDEINLPGEMIEMARKFLFFQLYRTSLPFGKFIKDGVSPGYIQLRRFSPKDLHPHHSKVIKTVVNGILEEAQFELETESQ